MFVFVACLNACVCVCVCGGGVSIQCLVAPSSDLGYREMVERERGQSVCVCVCEVVELIPALQLCI